jgi:hypothetical protein
MKRLLFLLVSAFTLLAADATGKWTGTLTPDGGGDGPAYLVLKQEGTKLTGTAGPGEGEQTPIENGKVDGANITFELPAGGSVMKFVLKQEGEEIKRDISRERDGQKQTAKLAVKREK